MDVTGLPTSAQATMTVTDIPTGVPMALYPAGSCLINGRVLCQVLSGAICATFHDKGATPTLNDFQFYTGDMFVAEPPQNLRLIRNGTSACVKFQVYEG